MPEWKHHIRAHLGQLSCDAGREQEIFEEVSQGLEALYEEALSAGAKEDEAVQSALAELGPEGVMAKSLRQAIVPPAHRRMGIAVRSATRSIPIGRTEHAALPWGLWRDLCFGARMLAKNPVFTLTALLTLAIAIGANTAIFGVVNGLLLNPFPFPQSDRLVSVEARHVSGQNNGAGYRDFLDWRSRNSVFTEMSVLGWESTYTLTGVGEPQRITGSRTTESFLRVLAVRPLIGRFFSPDDDRKGGPPVAVLSYASWQRLFGGHPDIVGQSITLNGRPTAVLGVMPSQFVFPGQRTCDFWEPLQEDPENSRGQHQYGVIARLQPGISLEQAQSAMTSIASSLEREFPLTNTGWRITVTPIGQALAQDTKAPVLALFSTVLFVLLIACINVAGLLLSRTLARSREIALRAALGASRMRIVRQMLTESLMLAALGGALGVLFAYWLLALVRAAAPSDFGLDGALRVDFVVLAFTLAASLLTGIGFGVAPAWFCAKTDLNLTIKGGSNALGRSRSRNWFLAFLVVGEVALSLVLLVAAGLLIRDFRWILHLNTGIEARHVLTFAVRLQPNQGAETMSFYQQLLDRLRATAGVSCAGAVYTLPMTGSYSGGGFKVEGQPDPTDSMEMNAQYNAATPDYFRSMGIPLLLGRDFDTRDSASASPVAIIDQTMAQRFFAGRNPLGHRIRIDMWRTIVGVVGAVKHQQPMRPPRPQIYQPYAQTRGGAMWVTLRTAGEPTAIIADARSIVHSLRKDALMEEIRPMTQVIAESLNGQQWIMWFMSGFAAFALLLASTGLYGVIAYSVTQRIQEIGVRMALGARQGDILALVIGKSTLLTGFGIMIGIPFAVGASRLMRSLLYGISPHDWLVLTVVPILLLSVTLAASCVPARRAVRVDPLVALRQE